MASRWAFEALAINQFKENQFEKQFYPYDQAMSLSSFKRNFWLSEVKKRVELCKLYHDDPSKAEVVGQAWTVIRNELMKELKNNTQVQLGFDIRNQSLDVAYLDQIENYLSVIKTHYNQLYNESSKVRNQIVHEMQTADSTQNLYIALQNKFHNENLADLVLNNNSVDKIIEYEGELVQKTDPAYKNGQGFRSHFFAPNKLLFGERVDTFWINILVLFLYTVLLFVTLYFDLLKKGLDKIAAISIRLKLSKEE